MRVDSDDYHRLQWTHQPGEGWSHITVEGASDVVMPSSGTSPAHDQLPALFLPDPPKDGAHGGRVALRDYQHECVSQVDSAWRRGTKAPLVVLPTGSGKTIIASALMDSSFVTRGHRSIFCAHRRELLTQTVDKLRLTSSSTRIVPRIGIVQGKDDHLHSDITIASIQTLGGSRSSGRLQRFVEAGPYHILVVDEAHHAVSPQYLRVINALREAYPDICLLGMTATPGRADGTALDTVFDEVVFERNLLDMIQLGYLVPPKGFKVELGLNLDDLKSSGGDYVTKQLSKLMNQPQVHRAVVEAWCRYGHNRKTVVFCVDVEHAKSLAQEFRDAGYAAEHVDGAMKIRDRDAVLRRFRDGETKILLNCEIATEGFDEPSIEAVLFARPTQSQPLYIQALGRGLRLFPGKTECLVIDCVGNSEKHKPVQLASLAGFDPERRLGGAGGPGNGEDEDDGPLIPTVVSANPQGSEVDLTGMAATTKYPWVETKLGWVLNIPRIGYYLVAWSTNAHTRCTIRFYDQRPGRRQSLPVDVVAQPIDFQLAYGLVEAEMDRIFNARAGRSMMRRPDGSVYEDPRSDRREFRNKEIEELPEVNFVDLDEGLDEQTDIPEELIQRGAAWRSHSTTRKQADLLRKLGVKDKSMPKLAGEASDLITILRLEKDAKMRMPMTPKQVAYFKVNELSFPDPPTKGTAATIIWKHRKATGY